MDIEASPAPKLTVAQRHLLKHKALAAQNAAAAASTDAPTEAVHIKPTASQSGTPTDLPAPSSRMTVAQRHRLKHQALAAAAAAGETVSGVAPDRDDMAPGATEYELLRAQLGNDLAEIRDQPSVERKIELKLRKLPAYADYIESVIAAGVDTGKAVQDEVFVMLMIWAIDVANWELAFAMATHVMQFGLQLPERFNRSPGAFILEQVADAGLKAATLKELFPVPVLTAFEGVTESADANDIIRAKMQKAIGLHLVAAANALEPDSDGPAGQKQAMFEQALTALRRALTLHDKSGVKKDIENLERALKKIEPAGA